MAGLINSGKEKVEFGKVDEKEKLELATSKPLDEEEKHFVKIEEENIDNNKDKNGHIAKSLAPDLDLHRNPGKVTGETKLSLDSNQTLKNQESADELDETTDEGSEQGTRDSEDENSEDDSVEDIENEEWNDFLDAQLEEAIQVNPKPIKYR